MVGAIRRFFCPHDWEVVVKEKLSNYGEVKSATAGFVLIQRCKKCGKVQKDIIKYG